MDSTVKFEIEEKALYRKVTEDSDIGRRMAEGTPARVVRVGVFVHLNQLPH